MKWLRFPDRIDVILHPRDWRVRLYGRGVILTATGMFCPDGTVCCGKFRFGPPINPRLA